MFLLTLGEPFWVLLCQRPRSLQGVPRKGEHSPRLVALPDGAAERPGRLQPGGGGGASVAPRLSLSALGVALLGASGRSRVFRPLCLLLLKLKAQTMSLVASRLPPWKSEFPLWAVSAEILESF